MTIQQRFADIFQSLREQAPTDYRKTDRLLRELEGGAALRVGLMGNMTLDFVVPYLRVAAARVGQIATFHVSPFGQYMQALHGDELHAFMPDMLLLALSPQMMRPDAFARYHSLAIDERIALREGIVAEVAGWMKAALARTSATLLIANFSSCPSALGLADLTSEYGEQQMFLELNLALIRITREEPRVHLLDIAAAAQRVGFRQAFDARLQHLAKLSWTEPMMREVSEVFAHAVVGTRGLARKCLVVDLDNTLWGGVVGEDGPHGVRVGQGDMISEAFHAFQTRVRALKDRGILLAICSKNNPEDVEDMFRSRPDMPLRLSDFSAKAIGWDAKHDAIGRIAATLDIGLDSMVFIDDNPAEVASMRACRPDVQSILLPSDPAQYVDLLDNLPWFEKGRLSAEDGGKAEQYRLAAERDTLRVALDPQDYLRDLRMQAVIRAATRADLVRVHQLFTKTNQFNLTTRRLGLGDVEALLDDEQSQLLVAGLRDRFGDLGMVAAYVLRAGGGGVMEIDHLLMSCRAMGRGLENALMNDAKRRFLARRDMQELRAAYVPTPRNRVVAGFYENQGFTAADQGSSVRYRLGREEVGFMPCDWISWEACDDDQHR